jgi:hypothetical protein
MIFLASRLRQIHIFRPTRTLFHRLAVDNAQVNTPPCEPRESVVEPTP